MKVLYSERGGYRVGKNYFFAVKGSWPFAKLEIYREKIIFYYLFGKAELPKSDIDSFEKYGFIFKGLKINHHKKGVPSFLLFLAWNVNGLLKKLKKYEFVIKNGTG